MCSLCSTQAGLTHMILLAPTFPAFWGIITPGFPKFFIWQTTLVLSLPKIITILNSLWISFYLSMTITPIYSTALQLELKLHLIRSPAYPDHVPTHRLEYYWLTVSVQLISNTFSKLQFCHPKCSFLPMGLFLLLQLCQQVFLLRPS